MNLLPVSGLTSDLRHPNGADELSLCEATGSAVSRSLTLLSRLSDRSDWSALTVTDFEVLLLQLREQVIGDVCDLGFSCPQCATRVEVSFRISDFLDGIGSRRPPGVEPVPGRSGWFRSEGVEFRLPTAGDQAAVEHSSDPLQALLERCIAPPLPPVRLRKRIERAMEALAPEVSRPLVGTCPGCDGTVSAPLHVARLVVSEFVRDAASLHDEVDLIARAYHWPEADILQLPRRRRRAYAERIRQAA
ncbi:hypothetical protein [Novosphingobium lentum]|uniref:T4 family baseplate hub assembly chaperone n=1 Tax=Novosphingobium lentum TaxID=145287 RepID=UPI000829A503|nr:hypothetical protein [Novosphingobium lentum]